MNRQPFQTPPRWWSPRLSPLLVRLFRPYRRRRVLREHGVSSVEVRGLAHVCEAMSADQGLLITPNHPTHADPYALLEAADELGTGFYFMTAWQVFAMTHRLGRRVLRHHGCFSINREGHDLRAFRQAVNILTLSSRPLVIFPEGEVFHLNDRTMPFRRGAATAAVLAARRGGRPVACIPCALKFQYTSDPTPELNRLMGRLEESLTWAPRGEMPLAKRIHRFAEGVLSLKEAEYFGAARVGRLQSRIERLVDVILGRLEDRYAVFAPPRTVPERVKHLRHRVIGRLESMSSSGQKHDDPDRGGLERDLDDLFFAVQLYSYPVDYVAQQPTIERLAETLDKLEEDVLGVPTAGSRGIRKAIVSFGEPVIAQPSPDRRAAAELTETLQHRVQGLLDQIGPARGAVFPTPAIPLPSLPASRPTDATLAPLFGLT